MNKLGFGLLRPPKKQQDGQEVIDHVLLAEMVDTYLAAGGKYFDTAYTYLKGESERALRRALVERYPRDAFLLADKLPTWLLTSEEDCEVFYLEQCERCGVTRFDVYLLHWLNATIYSTAERYGAFAFLRKLKAEGKAGKIGFSYHDDAKLLDRILTDHPEVDLVQLQINYLDWESVSVQAAKCYEVACRHRKEVIVMEPVKGGTLASLPEEAEAKLRVLRPQASIASWAIRFVTELEQVSVVLSGMNTMEQLRDNLSPHLPLTREEQQALREVTVIINRETAIHCTGCGYCASTCPKHIAIPRCFALYNEYARKPEEGWKVTPVYDALCRSSGKASDCIACRRCEGRCPQKLPIVDLLKRTAAALEANE
ncbi:MAG: aldo/keto reductase [Clostridia bacterium]|nr:aldo/keto reductase [Clostridia bacterium]